MIESVSRSIAPLATHATNPTSKISETPNRTVYPYNQRNDAVCHLRLLLCSSAAICRLVTVWPLSEDVSRTAYRANCRFLAGLIDLSSQPAHMHVDQIGAGIEVIAPDCLEQHRARDRLAGVTQHEFEHLV